MLTALEDKAATKHAPRSPDRDVGSDDDESMHSVDSHGARIGPYTPERGAPPSYEHVMLSPMPTEPPSTPPRLGHHCSYSGEGERGNHRVLTLFLGRVTPFFDARDASARPPPRLATPISPPLTPSVSPPRSLRPQAAPSTTRWASPSPTGSPRGAFLSATRLASSDETTRLGGVSRSAGLQTHRSAAFFLVSERPRPDIGPRPGSVLTLNPKPFRRADTRRSASRSPPRARNSSPRSRRTGCVLRPSARPRAPKHPDRPKRGVRCLSEKPD